MKQKMGLFMFTQIKAAAMSSLSNFFQDILGVTALLVILFTGLHLPVLF